jgi:hypothetical protein
MNSEDRKLFEDFMQWGNYCPASDWDAYDRLPCAPLFDVSWDWLMPVFYKMNKVRILEYDEYGLIEDAVDEATDSLMSFDIKDAYNAALVFIKKYNKIKYEESNQ